MERENLRRQNSGPQRSPRLYLGQKRRRRPPKFLLPLAVLAAIAGVVFLIVKLAGGKGQEDGPPQSDASASASSLVDAAFSSEAPQAPTPDAQPTADEPDAPDSAPLDLGEIMVVDGAAYEYYKFSEEAANQYILAVDAAGKALAGSATVYDMVVPTSIDVLLPDSYLTEHQVETSDQRKAIDRYMYPSITAMNPDVKTVPLFDPLRAHAGEYIYFQSDRTWTQLGAYYAYVEFCKAKGLEPAPLENFSSESYEGFLGGFSGSAEDMLYADTVTAYFPGGNRTLTYYDEYGESVNWPVIHSGDEYDSSLLYLIFAAGDHDYKVLENKDLTDGSACLVVQDSFGNYLTPFLTGHYQYVYVVDYRSYEGSVKELTAEVGATDVLILTNIMATASTSAVESLTALF